MRLTPAVNGDPCVKCTCACPAKPKNVADRAIADSEALKDAARDPKAINQRRDSARFLESHHRWDRGEVAMAHLGYPIHEPPFAVVVEKVVDGVGDDGIKPSWRADNAT